MTSFKISTDDSAVRALQEANKKPVITGPVLPVKASNPVQKSPENPPLQNAHANNQQAELAHSQRRQHDRRQTHQSVLLNTRSKHDRRVNEEVDESESYPRGIDKLV